MNISQAKQEIVRTFRAYTRRNDDGSHRIPLVQQRPLLLIGPPGIGKTAIVRQIARETDIGLVANAKTRTPRNNSLMSYITLEDDTGMMELIAFQRALDQGGSYVKDAAALLVRGRISLRDEKEPQLMVDSIRPLSDLNVPGASAPRTEAPAAPASDKPRTLYVRLPSREHPLYRRIELLLTMFPGRDRLVLYFEDSKKKAAAPCLIHEALLAELTELCGEENVVVK